MQEKRLFHEGHVAGMPRHQMPLFGGGLPDHLRECQRTVTNDPAPHLPFSNAIGYPSPRMSLQTKLLWAASFGLVVFILGVL
jgi:hypothetical protein